MAFRQWQQSNLDTHFRTQYVLFFLISIIYINWRLLSYSVQKNFISRRHHPHHNNQTHTSKPHWLPITSRPSSSQTALSMFPPSTQEVWWLLIIVYLHPPQRTTTCRCSTPLWRVQITYIPDPDEMKLEEVELSSNGSTSIYYWMVLLLQLSFHRDQECGIILVTNIWWKSFLIHCKRIFLPYLDFRVKQEIRLD